MAPSVQMQIVRPARFEILNASRPLLFLCSLERKSFLAQKELVNGISWDIELKASGGTNPRHTLSHQAEEQERVEDFCP